MPISLPSELEQFAQSQVDSGNYESIESILVAGLKLLAERDESYQRRLEMLRQDVMIGVEAADRGELLDFDTEMENIRLSLKEKYQFSRESSTAYQNWVGNENDIYDKVFADELAMR